jgi:hypothetical protein
MVVTDLESALVEFSRFAVDSFKAALAQAESQKRSDQEQAVWEAETARGKVQMASALQQLVQADVMLSELKGRNSYRTLVGLIVTANTALNSLIGNPGGLTVQEQTQLITAHAALLESLAEIVPLALWHEGQANTAMG